MPFTSPDLESIKDRPVAVLGGGVLGRRIACTWAAAGWTVNIHDISEEQLNAAIHYVEQHVTAYAKTIFNSSPGTAIPFRDLEPAVRDAWTVIEAVPEKIQLKIDTFGSLAKLTRKDCLLASNSSSYKTSEMLEKVDEDSKRRILNTHYMLPPENRVVELMTDGVTDDDIIPFYVDRLRDAGMRPFVAQKESTGFVFNRVWAAVKRECLTILAEGVSVPEELDNVWTEMFGGNQGPCAMMDAVGLDTVELIEEHYIKERGLSSQFTVDFLKKEYIEQGKLGAKSGKGGLYPAGYTTKTSSEKLGDHHNLHAPILYFLDIGWNHLEDPLRSGKILAVSAAGGEPKTLAAGLALPDGLDISLKNNRIFWTNMGVPTSNDGSVQSCNLDGSDIQTIIKPGDVHTAKQIIIDHENDKLYFCDREGMRVIRCDLDGSNQETIVQNGDWKVEEETTDKLRWCVGIAVDARNGFFYWTQKGTSKGGKGKILRANIRTPPGQSAINRIDIETIFTGLPEPIDLEVDAESDKLFWTDRGDPPYGNTINSVDLKLLANVQTQEDNPKFEILANNLHEAVGIKLDNKNKHIYATDLGGAVYRFDIDGKNKTRVFTAEEGSFTGITLAYV